MDNVNLKKYDDFETFRTPEWVYASLIKKFPEYFVGNFFDPSAGDGRMGKYLLDNNISDFVTLCDIRDESEAWQKISNKYPTRVSFNKSDFLELHPKDNHLHSQDVILTNPPFTLTTAFVEHSWQYLKLNGRIIILQRLNFLGSLRRREFFENNHLENLITIGRRPIWEIDGREKNIADTYDYAFYCFSRNTNIQKVSWIYPDK